MTHKLANPTFKQDLKTETTDTQNQILKFINEYGRVHRKIVYLKNHNFADKTLRANIANLKNKDCVKENSNGALELTEIGRQVL